MSDWSIWLQEQLDKLDWRQEDAAAHLGISFSTIQDWLAGRHAPQPLYRESVERQIAEHLKAQEERGNDG